jgi:hyperosmotically inducible protein
MRNKFAFSLIVILALAFVSLAKDKEVMTDGTITDQVSIKLTSDAIVKGGAIKVDVKDGVVTLAGQVEEIQQKDRAAKLAKGVKGVKSVVNNLTLRDPQGGR